MLATLNLQLFPVEMLDDSLPSPASLLPEAVDELESGFADLLRLRVDASLSPDQVGGELLPQGGSALPMPELPSVLDNGNRSLPIPDIDVEVLAQVAPTPLIEQPDISLEAPVIYPPLSETPAHEPIAATLQLPARSGKLDAMPAGAVSPDDGIADSLELTRLPVNVLRTTEAELAADVRDTGLRDLERNAGTSPGIGLPPRVQSGVPQRTAPITMSAGVASEAMPLTRNDVAAGIGRAPLPAPVPQPVQTVDAAEFLSAVDLSKRPDAVPIQRAEAVGEALTELIRPRGTVSQPVQTLQAQFSAQAPQAPQAPQPMFASATGVTGVADASYTAAAQQATDLVSTPVRDTAWGEQIGQRVLLMAANQMKTAEIRLTPAELGPLRVQVSLDDGATHVAFHAQNAVTREAIEQALPRLREMFAENGLSLGQADVGEQGVAEGNRDGQADGRLSDLPVDDKQEQAADDDGGPTTRVLTSNGLVDTFA